MADKLNDSEIVNELKRFGETVKVPIDKKRRPILIKKLNHHYAKENPPPKRGKSGNRLSKSQTKPAEFSDDSQDESEFESRPIRKSYSGRNSTEHNSLTNNSPRKSRNRIHDNGASASNLVRNSLRSRSSTGKSKNSTARQVEIYPNEFSDNDTADESVYVEEKSIGINTTMNYEDDDDDDNDGADSLSEQVEIGYPKTSAMLSTPNNKMNDPNITTVSPAVYRGNKNTNRKSGTKVSESEHFISKTILTIMGIFFVILAAGYVYVKRDIFIPGQTTPVRQEVYKTFDNYSEEQVKKSWSIVNQLHEYLADLKGQYELGDKEIGEAQMSIENVRKFIQNAAKDTEVDMFDLCLKLIIKFSDRVSNIQVFTDDGDIAQSADDISFMEGMYGNLPLTTRIILALYKVLYGLCLLVVCILVGVMGIFYLRWQKKKKEQMQQKVYDLVEKIIEMLKDNFEMSERKNDNKNYPPYMAVEHIRDQLIPVAKRRQMQPLWEEAVQFIESNESRIRVETQVIQGEEYNVWRWLQALPNGHKMWQGQAFGETSQGAVTGLPYGPTPCLKVRNMFDANMEQNVDDWHLDIEEGILEKCKDNHGILHIFVDRTSREGCVYIKCISCEKAYEAYQALHGWWFDGRLITVKYLRLEHYHDRFPDSRNKRHPLKPSKCEMPSVSQPYHKSALEMT